MIELTGEKYLSRRQAAELCGFSDKTLAKWAVLGKGPKFSKFGASRSAPVRYPLSKLLRFMAEGGAEAS